MRSIKRLGRGSSAYASILAIAAGLVAGFAILIISNPENALKGMWIILKGGFNSGAKGMGQVLYKATPIIMTGLSVGFAFKTGLFNIGAAGQLMVGGFAAVYAGARMSLPYGLHWAVALLIGMAAGGLWGAVPGFFKAYLNVNEVISSIMMNYIGMYGVNYLIKISPVYDSLKNQTIDVMAGAVIPKAGLDKVFYAVKGRLIDVSSVNAGVFIAIAMALAIYVVLNKTTFGYELKACGYNRHASRYAGIDEKRSILLSMAIAGALAGAAGGLMYLAPGSGMHIHVDETMAAEGFNGIPVALLGLSNPIGIIFSGIFVAYINEGGSNLESLKYRRELIDIIVALIIYFSAFSQFARDFAERRRRRRATAASAIAPIGGASAEGGEAEPDDRGEG